MDMGFSCRKNAFLLAPIKLTHHFRPQNCGHEFYGHEDFSELPRGECNCETRERQKLSCGNFCLAASRCLSRPSGFFVLFGTFPIFPGFSRFARGWSGDFPDSSLSLSRPIKSSYEEQSRKGPRHDPDLSRKKSETPEFGNPRA